MLEQVRKEAHAAAQQICEAAKLRQGQILVVGCSTSEVTGHKVGSYSSPELGQAIYEGMQEVLIPRGIYLAAQCCEHLNRAIIVEAEAVGQGEICNVVPQPKAGGSFATAAYHGFRHPVALEQIQADAGLDIAQDPFVNTAYRRLAFTKCKSHTGIQPRYSGLRVQGTANSPPSATNSNN